MDLSSALTTEGPLQKQSPNMFKVFQTRYFAIRGKGEYLVWFKKKPINPDQNPKGILKIEYITQILSEEDNRLFSIVYSERTFNFRAESVAVKQRWVNSLQAILNHYQKLNKNKTKPVENAVESWKWQNNANQSITQQIRLENQQVILQDSEGSIGKKSEAFLAFVLKDKSLTDIQNCVIYGLYQKKKMIGGSLRWFFLASGVNLKDQKDQELYGATQQLFSSLNEPENKMEKQEVKKAEGSSSQDEAEQIKDNNKKLKDDKKLRINTLFEYDLETKQVKYTYNLVDIISFEMKGNEQPFQLKFVYEQVVNEEEEEVKEIQICLTSNFLIQIKKMHNALKIINQKYNLQKVREQKNANKSKRYPAKKWKYVNEDQWRVPEEKASLYVLLSKKLVRINMLTINLQDITSHSKESIKIAVASNSNEQNPQQKKQDALQIVFKKQKQEYKIYIQFDKTETMIKFMKKLSKNIKKVQEAIQAENSAKIMNRRQQQKKSNESTYLIDKKIRETHSSIKVNFYELMDREVIQEKKEENPNKNDGFFGKIMSMFCTGPSPLDLG